LDIIIPIFVYCDYPLRLVAVVSPMHATKMLPL